MQKQWLVHFSAYQQQLDDIAYLQSRIIFSCAPTIAALKPATLLNFGQTGRDLNRLWRTHRLEFPRRLGWSLGLTGYELRRQPGATLVLFFNRFALAAALYHPENRMYLENLGYPVRFGIDSCLTCLKHRLKRCFPHEIGIFLGIPAADVAGFIENQGRNFIFNGYWKVYQAPERAQALFAQFDQVRLEMIRAILRK